jgi:hypothetical protein
MFAGRPLKWTSDCKLVLPRLPYVCLQRPSGLFAFYTPVLTDGVVPSVPPSMTPVSSATAYSANCSTSGFSLAMIMRGHSLHRDIDLANKD